MATCKEIQELFPVHAVDDATVEEALQVEEHVSHCGSCRADLEDYRRLCRTVRRELAALPPEPAGKPWKEEWKKKDRYRGIPAWGTGLAAAALLVFGILLGRWMAPVPPAPAGSGAAPGMPETVEAERPPSRPARLRVLLSRIPRASIDLEDWPIERKLRRRPTLSVFSPTARLYFRKVAERQ